MRARSVTHSNLVFTTISYCATLCQVHKHVPVMSTEPVITQFIESLNLVFKDMTTFKSLVIRCLFLLVLAIIIILGLFAYALFDMRRDILQLLYQMNRVESAIRNLSQIMSLDVLTKLIN